MACCWAGVQIHQTLQNNSKATHARLRAKIYKEVVPAILSMENLPSYVTEAMFFCTDVNGTKERPDDEKANEALWNNWLESKKFITNRDNHAVRRAGTTMVGKAVPSGKGMEAWVEALFDQFYQAQLAESHVQEPGLGGSAAKAASVEYDTAATGEAALDAGTSMECEVQDDEEPAEDLSPEKMKDNSGTGQAQACTAEDEEPAEDLSPEKKKAKKDTATGNETPSSFFPKYLYFIMRWGILADEPQEPLCEILTVGDNSDIPVKKATGPSRAELRTSLQVEAKAAASTHKVDKNELGGNSPKGGGRRRSRTRSLACASSLTIRRDR